ncbi:MAG: HipA N-terminal domain-containing protein [Myxococcota bacterium]|nr:HipA N-terminal domain-containing protein [Myxococcota bacterium]
MSQRFEAIVELSGNELGRLERDRYGRTWFRPSSAWLAGGQYPRLGHSFLLNPAARMAGTGLLPWFQNLLPEQGSPLRRLLCRRAAILEHDSEGLLCALGNDLPGAVVVRPVHRDTKTAQAEQRTLPEQTLRFSLAGVQLKFSMIRNEDRFALPARNELGKWIVKLPGSGIPELQPKHKPAKGTYPIGIPQEMQLAFGACPRASKSDRFSCLTAPPKLETFCRRRRLGAL